MTCWSGAWDRVVQPVFAELGLTEPPPAGQATHLWWCATGLAAFLPLHAAGAHGSSAPTRYSALDLAVSSYTPSLRTLIQLRQRQPARESQDLADPFRGALHQPGRHLDP